MSPENSSAWICGVCGYVHRGEETPECCPLCGAMQSDFEPYSEPTTEVPVSVPSQWQCLNCNYIHDGAEPPEFCPACGAPPDQFEAVAAGTVAAPVAGAELRVVVIGGGIASVAACETIRKNAPDATVTLVCQERKPPYYRLNLTRYLAGEIHEDALPIHPEDWYAENGIGLVLDAEVRAANPEIGSVELGNGSKIPFDRLILAMGSHAFVPPIPGSDLPEVVTLRTSQDAESIIKRIASGASSVVVIGGGVLGIETAGAIAQRGGNVTLLESHEWLMPRQLNQQGGDLLESHLIAAGVRLRKQARTREVTAQNGALHIALRGGQDISTDLVVLATGVRPNTYLARKAGLDVNRGIVVDNHLRTSHPAIFAAGDVAEHNGTLYGAWGPSQFQGTIAAMNALGVDTPFGGLPRANALKILDVELFSIGQFQPEDGSYIVLDHEADGTYAHFVFRDGKMVGAILLGFPGTGTTAKKAIETEQDFSDLLLTAETGADVLAAL